MPRVKSTPWLRAGHMKARLGRRDAERAQNAPNYKAAKSIFAKKVARVAPVLDKRKLGRVYKRAHGGSHRKATKELRQRLRIMNRIRKRGGVIQRKASQIRNRYPDKSVKAVPVVLYHRRPPVFPRREVIRGNRSHNKRHV